ncbi:MAG: tRNA (N(6)-L-threonylcarbamoyladenosine(37)-C(2))-methylthiotransferase MtaB [Clostridia bacterium]|nr:tRNA (N(6)-L-threonylcarbamoyladenosine(37)-C(2))-methylthiotransferase MtaB [Clostridia bacterium]
MKVDAKTNNMKVAFYTLGCKVNQYETNLLKEQFEKSGYEIVDNTEKADIYCINTCTVTNMSDRKTRQAISRMKKLNENSIIIVLGCYVESIKDATDVFKNVDIVLGNEEKSRVIEAVNNFKEKNNKIKMLEDISKVKTYKKQEGLKHGYGVRVSIKIEDGCNNFCSYCIIPYVRGRVRGREASEIINEVESLVSSGTKEVILVGIEISSYGTDGKKEGLIDIVEKVSNVQGLERIRLGSIEPRLLTEENIIRLKKVEKFCPHFHISMQSGSTDTLKRMNRKYDKNLLITVTQNIHKYFNDANITADLIVGFPGETEEEFNETQETIDKMGMSKIHVFKYSKRKYTNAAKMENQIDEIDKKTRSKKILDKSDSLTEEFMKKHINTNTKILFEEYNAGFLNGYTENYIMVKVRGEEELCGTIQDVDLISLGKEQMTGTLKGKN